MMIMKRFLVSNLFALIVFVIAAVIILSLDLTKGYTTMLMSGLAVGVMIFAAIRLFVFEKDDKTIPIINFDQHRIECAHTGKVLYQFTTSEWNRLTLDEKYDMARWFTLA
jgi:hypothetical protein